MKSLPKLYKNENNIKSNNKEKCIVEEKTENKMNETTIKDIDNIFNTNGFPFDKKVLLKTKDKEFKTYLVSRTEDKVMTINDVEINIEDILSIERL